MADQINIDCFKDMTIDGQLYEILSAISDLEVTLPAQIDAGEFESTIDGGEPTP
jgi:hypothetical protein